MIDFQKALNPEQFAAATAGDGPILVLAAAGTGKTRTLVHRVAYLVGHGVSPQRILLLTFTNRAAREMIERAEQLVGPAIGGVWSGTFHHVCSRFLRRYGSVVGFRPDFQILDEDDAKKLVAEAIKRQVENPKDFVKKELVLKIISDAANRERSVADVAAAMQSKEAGVDVEKVVLVAEDYARRKAELGVMDFDDLLVNALRLLRESQYVREALQEHFLHVLVDEYQDTNSLQAQLVDILGARHRNVLAVGDDFQCIYTWRGAQFENIMEFPSRWPGCRVLKLERNYRSVPSVLDVANAVMKDVPRQFEKTLRPFRPPSGSLPQRWSVFDGKSQAELVNRIVASMLEAGYRHSDIAVLYRSHFNALDIQMTLTRRGIPFRITSGTGFFEQLHVKDALAFLRVVLEPANALAFERLAALLPGTGDASAHKAWTKLGGSFRAEDPDARRRLGELLGKRAQAWYPQLDAAFAAAVESHAKGESHLMVDAFLREFYRGHLRREFDPEQADRREDDIKELQAQIAAADEGVEGFLREVALLTNLDAVAQRDRGTSRDAVTLTTVHQAKGMEWPVVVVPWVVEGLFPSKRSMDDGNCDEERRLFYVAVTRAKDRLFLLAPRVRAMADGGMCPCEMSRFLRCVPEGLFNVQSWNQPSEYGCGSYGGGRGFYGGSSSYGRAGRGSYNGRGAGGGYGRNSSRFGRW